MRDPSGIFVSDMVEPMVAEFAAQDAVKAAGSQLASGMTEAVMQKTILTKVGELTSELMGSMALHHF